MSPSLLVSLLPLDSLLSTPSYLAEQSRRQHGPSSPEAGEQPARGGGEGGGEGVGDVGGGRVERRRWSGALGKCKLGAGEGGGRAVLLSGEEAGGVLAEIDEAGEGESKRSACYCKVCCAPVPLVPFAVVDVVWLLVCNDVWLLVCKSPSHPLKELTQSLTSLRSSPTSPCSREAKPSVGLLPMSVFFRRWW